MSDIVQPTYETRNYWALIWHAVWLALAITFADVNTVLPALILIVGGTQLHIGILTSIMIGIPLISKLLFAGYLKEKELKKSYLLFGIYLRVTALAGIALTLFKQQYFSPSIIILIVFGWMIIFSLSSAFAGISYQDILGKSIVGETRKKFLVSRQFLSSLGLLISALIARELLKQFDYPENYTIFFISAAIFLFIAALGFLVIKEKPTKVEKDGRSLYLIFKSIPSVLKENKNMRNFIILSNLIGFAIVLIPFFIVLLKDEAHINKSLIGNFLLLLIIGMIISNYGWHKIVKKSAFKGVMKFAIIIFSLLPPIALIFAYYLPVELFVVVFLLTGTAISGYKIAVEGILLEITTESNRALYSGIFGAFNITISIFPLLIGILVMSLGYVSIFLAVSLLSFTALLFVNKLECSIDNMVKDNI
jgi:MFS family permease